MQVSEAVADHILNFCQRAVTNHTTKYNAPKFPDFHSKLIHSCFKLFVSSDRTSDSDSVLLEVQL